MGGFRVLSAARVRVALPNKGRLADDVRATLEDAGLAIRTATDRALTAEVGDDFLALFVRAQDIPEFVADGAADAGITGWDCVAESGRELDSMLDLGLGRCRLVVAARATAARGEAPLSVVPNGARVATSFPFLAKRFFETHQKPIQIVTVSGAAEVAPHLGIADVIVDLVSTGSTLKVNGLHEIATVLESTARLVSRPRAMLAEATHTALSDLALAISSVVRARGQRYLMANVPFAVLAGVRAILPGLRGPTVIDLADDQGKDRFVAVHAVIPAASVYRTTLRLKAIGCEGILVTRIERLIP